MLMMGLGGASGQASPIYVRGTDRKNRSRVRRTGFFLISEGS
jgi:hypothetical protein